MRALQFISRIILGGVFIYSGYVKAVDPIGSQYLFEKYFDAFGMEFLKDFALPMAMALISLEFILGVAILVGTKLKLATNITLVLMGYFTILTFVIYTWFNDVITNCGCFGDAMPLTNKETFLKNVIFMVPTLFLFFTKRNYQPFWTSKIEWTIIGLTVFGVVFIQYYSTNHLPIVDFRAYAIGKNIPEQMSVPEGAPVDVYETLLVYEKDGLQQEFQLNDPTWQDGTWTWVETKQKLIQEGYKPSITDFSVENDTAEITDYILNYEGYTFLVIAYKIKPEKAEYFEQTNAYYNLAEVNENVRFYALTAASYEKIEALNEAVTLNYGFSFTDDVVLKTMVRSHPGLILMKEGTIINKWHYNDFPSVEEISALLKN